MAASKLVRSTLVLSAANFCSKIMGFVYTFLILNLVGDEAYGLYQRGFLLYVSVLVVTTGGFPEALSILVAEKAGQGRLKEAKRFFRVTRLMLILMALVISVIFLLLLPYVVVNFYKDQRLMQPITVCTAAVIIVAISSTYRGFFQGMQDMVPPALAQFAEQVVRLGLSVYFGSQFLPYGVQYAALGLAVGMVGGEICHLLVLLYMSRRRAARGEGLSEALKDTFTSLRTVGGSGLGRLVSLGTPLTFGFLLSSIVLALEGMIIPQRLVAGGLSLSEGTALFGQLTGAAISIASLPTVFTFALATSLIPNISHYNAQNQVMYVHMRANEAFRLTVTFGLPFAVIFFFFPRELVTVFNSPEAAGALKILALGIVFSYLRDIAGGIIQGLGMPGVPVAHSAIASFFRLGLVYYLAAQPQWGIAGVALAYAIGSFVTSSLNLLFLSARMRFQLELKQIFLLPALGGAAMVLTVLAQKAFFPALPGVAGHIAAFAVFFGVYGVTLAAIGGITKQDILRFPGVANFIK